MLSLSPQVTMDVFFEGFLTQVMSIMHHADKALRPTPRAGCVKSTALVPYDEVGMSILCAELRDACDRARRDFETRPPSSPISSQHARQLATELARERSVSVALERKLEAKSRAVDHIRETLWKECCMLRFDLEERGGSKKMPYHASNFEAMLGEGGWEWPTSDTSPSPQALRATSDKENQKGHDKKWNDRLIFAAKQHEAEVEDFQRRAAQHVDRIEQLQGIIEAMSSEKDGAQGTVFSLAWSRVRDLEVVVRKREVELAARMSMPVVGVPADIAERLERAEVARDAAVAKVERLVAREKENGPEREAAAVANRAQQSMFKEVMESRQTIRRLQAQVTAVVGRFDSTVYDYLNPNDVGSVVSHPLLASVPADSVACVRAVMAEYMDLVIAPRGPFADVQTQTDDEQVYYELHTGSRQGSLYPTVSETAVSLDRMDDMILVPCSLFPVYELMEIKKKLKSSSLPPQSSFGDAARSPPMVKKIEGLKGKSSSLEEIASVSQSPRIKKTTKVNLKNVVHRMNVVNRIKPKQEKKPVEEVVAPLQDETSAPTLIGSDAVVNRIQAKEEKKIAEAVVASLQDETSAPTLIGSEASVNRIKSKEEKKITEEAAALLQDETSAPTLIGSDAIVNRIQSKEEKKIAEAVVAPLMRRSALRDAADAAREKVSMGHATFRASPPKKIPPNRPVHQKKQDSIITPPVSLPSNVHSDDVTRWGEDAQLAGRTDSEMHTGFLRSLTAEKNESVVTAVWDLQPSSAPTRRRELNGEAFDLKHQSSIVIEPTARTSPDASSPLSHVSFCRTEPHVGKGDSPSLPTLGGPSAQSKSLFQRGAPPCMVFDASSQNSLQGTDPLILGSSLSPKSTPPTILDKTAPPKMFSTVGTSTEIREGPQTVSSLVLDPSKRLSLVQPEDILHMPTQSIAHDPLTLSTESVKHVVSFRVVDELVPAEIHPKQPMSSRTTTGKSSFRQPVVRQLVADHLFSGTISGKGCRSQPEGELVTLVKAQSIIEAVPIVSPLQAHVALELQVVETGGVPVIPAAPNRSYAAIPQTHQVQVQYRSVSPPLEALRPKDVPVVPVTPNRFHATPRSQTDQGTVSPFVPAQTAKPEGPPPYPLRLVWSPNPRASPSIQSPRRIQTRALCLVPSTMGTTAQRKTSPACPIPRAPQPPTAAKWRPLPDGDRRFCA